MTEKIKDIGEGAKLLRELFGTKDGILAILFVVVVVAAGIIIRKDNRQIEYLRHEKTEALKQVSDSAQREAKLKDDCAEEMRKNLEWVVSFKDKLSDTERKFKTLEKETSSIIQQQKNIMYEVTND